VDHILFGGGIGENQPEVRDRILMPLAFLGVALSADRNATVRGYSGRITAENSRVPVDVVAVDENALMAADAIALTEEN
jgi:acetate kinase